MLPNVTTVMMHQFSVPGESETETSQIFSILRVRLHACSIWILSTS